MQKLRIFFTGLCMGAADLVPGISGGTIAFIMGIYDRLIESVKGFYLKKNAPFLVSLLTGMACSFLLLSHAIAYCLNNGDLRPLLYATFMGLIAASIVLLINEIKTWRWQEFVFLILGAIIAYVLSGKSFAQESSASPSTVWLMFSGAAAISAMLLPGISGSYIMIVLGVYPVALEAVADFSSGLSHGVVDISSSLLLSKILAGIVLGAALFSHAASWMLRRYRQATLTLLIGFMVGAMRTAWPFWNFVYEMHPFKPEKGLVLVVTNPVMPEVQSPLFWQAIACAVIGFACVLLTNISQKRYARHAKSL